MPSIRFAILIFVLFHIVPHRFQRITPFLINRVSSSVGLVRCALRFALAMIFSVGLVYPIFSQALQPSQMPDGQKPLSATAARIIGDETRIRFLIEFNQEPEIEFRYLNEPYRLILDLPNTEFLFDKSALEPRGLLKDLRYGNRSETSSRIILVLADAAVLEERQFQMLDHNHYRLVLDISLSSQDVFADIMADQTWNFGSSGRKSSRINLSGRDDLNEFILVLDAGHGGVDGGAEGRGGAIEKDITLAFVQKLFEELETDDNLKIILTRSNDKFLSLGARVRIGRQVHADLFISVHADSIRQRNLRGASVYTLSDRASDALTASLAASENRSDVIEGFNLDDAPDGTTDILLDLARRETETLSNQIADLIVADFEGQVLLITDPHRRAGFRVLKAPDVPSILIELGFLSNPEDEKLLISENWRRETARLLAQSIRNYKARILLSRK